MVPDNTIRRSKIGALISPLRYNQKDFFVCDVFDAYKDDMSSMEHPIFSLSTKKDLRTLEYSHNGNNIKIIPSTMGLPTIHDKDIILYLTSQIIAAINKGEKPAQTVRFIAHDLLVATNRKTDGRAYEQLKAALDRITGTMIKTNIKTGNEKHIHGFGIIDSYGIVERSPTNQRMVAVEVKLSDWLYSAILNKEVLTISPEYFRIRRPLERRLYELARKHCGEQNRWAIGIETLRKKLGTTAPLKKLRYNLRQVDINNHLPDYDISISYDEITFWNKRKNCNRV